MAYVPVQLSKVWHRYKPHLDTLSTAMSALAAAAQAHSKPGKQPKAAVAQQLLDTAASAAEDVRTALTQLRTKRSSEQGAQDASTAEWDPSLLVLPIEASDAAEQDGNAESVTIDNVADQVSVLIAVVEELRSMFDAMQQAAGDVASALQEHASRIRQPSTAAGVSFRPAAPATSRMSFHLWGPSCKPCVIC
jgi:hypothetical protein